jgi:hypothetical protein
MITPSHEAQKIPWPGVTLTESEFEGRGEVVGTAMVGNEGEGLARSSASSPGKLMVGTAMPEASFDETCMVGAEERVNDGEGTRGGGVMMSIESVPAPSSSWKAMIGMAGACGWIAVPSSSGRIIDGTSGTLGDAVDDGGIAAGLSTTSAGAITSFASLVGATT